MSSVSGALGAPACTRCGEPDRGGSACSRCGGSLLVDLVRTGAPVAGKVQFEAARALAGLGPPAPTFGEAKDALASPEGRLLRGVSATFARKATALLGGLGIAVEPRPVEPPPRRSNLRWLLAAAAPLTLIAAVSLWRAGRGEPVSSAPVVTPVTRSAAPPATLLSRPDPLGPPSAQPAPPPVALTTQQIAEAALPAVVAVHCKDHQGSGFFIAPGVVLTNAHVACPGEEPVEVRLQDGRKLTGKTVARDEWLDFARIEVSDPGVKPLTPGDATRLAPGVPIVFIGSPRGLEFTVHDGKVSYLGRELQGVGYIQFGAAVNPGNSGGPLLDPQGNVVGIVSLKLRDTDGIGLALPIGYALPPAPGTGSMRWTDFLRKVTEQDEQNRKDLLEHARLPHLADVAASAPAGLTATILQSNAEVLRGSGFTMRVEQRGTQRCLATVQVGEWRSIDERLQKDAERSRVVEWLQRTGLAKNLLLAAGQFDLRGCPPLEGAPVRFTLRSGADDAGTFEVSAGEFANLESAGRGSALQQEVHQFNQSLEVARHDDVQRAWKKAYAEARQQLDAARRQREQARLQLEQLGAGDWRAARVSLDDAERQLAEAEEALHALDRKAANLGVPLEWRR